MTFQYDLTAKIVRPGDLSAEEIKLWEQFCNDDPSLGHPFFSFAFASAVDRVRPHVFVAVLETRHACRWFFPIPVLRADNAGYGRCRTSRRKLGRPLWRNCRGTLSTSIRKNCLALARLNSLSYAYMPAEQLQHGFPKQRSVIGQQVRLTGDAALFWSGLRKPEVANLATQLERKE